MLRANPALVVFRVYRMAVFPLPLGLALVCDYRDAALES
jgi:hypothetical protein